MNTHSEKTAISDSDRHNRFVQSTEDPTAIGLPSIHNMDEVCPFSPAELNRLKIIHPGLGESREIKSFRDIRTRLLHISGGKPFSCLVLGVNSGGASHVAANLAASIALDKTKTSVLVDCNFYTPTVDRFLLAGSELGLTDYLDNPAIECQDIVYATGIPRMRVVPVGNNREGGTEKLSSQRMKSFMKELVNRYRDRFLIVDAPPAYQYDAEARILSEMCDYILLVVTYGSATADQVISEVKSLGPHRLAGIVFNQG